MSQITLEQRYEIAALRTIGKTLADIGDIVGFHKGTISKELRRNCDQRSGKYNPNLTEKKIAERDTGTNENILCLPPR